MIKYKEYVNQVTPEGGVFSKERQELGVINNISKWIGLRTSYLFYFIGVSPNALDIIGLFCSFTGYFFLMDGIINKTNHFVVIGWMLICFQVLIDYMDGAIARASKINCTIGTEMDNIGLEFSKFMLFIVLGILTTERLFILINVFSSIILLILFINTFKKIPDYKLIVFFKNIISGRRAILGVRFMIGIIPLLIIISYFASINIIVLSKSISLFYLFFALVWIFICLPAYSSIKS